MSPRIVEYKKEHAEWIFRNNLRDQDLGVLGGIDLSVFAAAWENKGSAWSLLNEKGVIGCGGMVLGEWRKGTAWLLLSELFYGNVRIVYKTIKVKLQEVVEEKKLRRVDMYVDCSLPKAVRFGEALGFELEGRLRAFGPNGEDFFILGRVY